MWQGVLLALAAAVTHTVIDGLRKNASTVLTSSSLVFLVAVLDALISCSTVALSGNFKVVKFKNPEVFAFALLTSSALLLYTKFLYQQALTISPISMTVPFLAVSPAFLVVTAFVFLGEVPAPSGIVGISIVTLGSFLLSRQSTSSSASTGKQLKRAVSTDDVTVGGASLLHATSSGSLQQSSNGADAWPERSTSSGQQPQHGMLLSSNSSSQQALLPYSRSNSSMVALDKSAFSQAGPIAGHTSILVDSAAAPEAPTIGLGRLLGRSWRLGTAARSSTLDHVNGGLHIPAGSDSKQALAAQPTHKYISSGNGASTGGAASAQQGHKGSSSTSRLGSSIGLEPGSALMLLVAALWSITASLDKLGVLHAPSVWVYFALQRLVIGAASCGYLVLYSRSTFQLLRTRHVGLLVLLSLAEMLAVVLFLEAIRYLFVSYVVAIKRCNVLLSVLLGGLVFQESITRRLPYVLLMLCGMTLLVLDPGALALLHHHHQRAE